MKAPLPNELDPFEASVQFERAILGAIAARIRCSESPETAFVHYQRLGHGSNGVVYEVGLTQNLQLYVPNAAAIRFAAKYVYNYGVPTSEVSLKWFLCCGIFVLVWLRFGCCWPVALSSWA